MEIFEYPLQTSIEVENEIINLEYELIKKAGGPDAEYVRNDIEESFWKMWKEEKPELNSLLIQKCIDRIIPKTRVFFCPWRMYHDTEKREIKNAVKRLYDKKIENAKNIINSKFIPHVLHQLYKYDGIMMKKTKEHFNEHKKMN
tara:strand:- start:3034 stop:3465 length:432 start_codon:yes stop_codon:yes gene_type:complete